MAWTGGRTEQAADHFDRAISLLEGAGLTHPAARVSARLGDTLQSRGMTMEALARMEQAYEVLSEDEPDEDLAVLLHQVGRLTFFLGEDEKALGRIEQALDLAESLWLPEVLSHALNTKALVLSTRHPEESLALMRHALRLAEENDLSQASIRAMYNLADRLQTRDRYDESLEMYRRGLALARKLGNRVWEWRFQAELAYQLQLVGEWDEALDLLEKTIDEPDADVDPSSWLLALPEIYVARGEGADQRAVLERYRGAESASEPQSRAGFHQAMSVALLGEGRFAEALAAAEAGLQDLEALGFGHQLTKVLWIEALEASAQLGDLDKVEALLGTVDRLPPGQVAPSMEAQRTRFRAKLAAARGEAPLVQGGFKSAAGLLRELGMRFPLAVTLLEHGEWLVAQRRAEEAAPLLAEAREIFEQLKARPWVERAEAAAPVPAAEPVGG
jgi:tetratricopeptide (TPR) repeat protein